MGRPLNSAKIIAETMKEANTIIEASGPETDLGKILLPKEVIKKPNSGNTGMSHAK